MQLGRHSSLRLNFDPLHSFGVVGVVELGQGVGNDYANIGVIEQRRERKATVGEELDLECILRRGSCRFS